MTKRGSKTFGHLRDLLPTLNIFLSQDIPNGGHDIVDTLTIKPDIFGSILAAGNRQAAHSLSDHPSRNHENAPISCMA